MKKIIRKIAFGALLIFLIGFLIPQNLYMPVDGASEKDFNENTFWYYPWGKSVTHKGVDIFAKEGTSIRSSTLGIVVFSGRNSVGGNVVGILGPQWRIHYYAHMQSVSVHFISLVNHRTIIGTVGSTGNAAGKPSHLHYAIATLLPYPWRIDKSKQGWLKMFYLNPVDYLKQHE